jgi:hypothetical protein
MTQMLKGALAGAVVMAALYWGSHLWVDHREFHDMRAWVVKVQQAQAAAAEARKKLQQPK